MDSIDLWHKYANELDMHGDRAVEPALKRNLTRDRFLSLIDAATCRNNTQKRVRKNFWNLRLPSIAFKNLNCMRLSPCESKVFIFLMLFENLGNEALEKISESIKKSKMISLDLISYSVENDRSSVLRSLLQLENLKLIKYRDSKIHGYELTVSEKILSRIFEQPLFLEEDMFQSNRLPFSGYISQEAFELLSCHPCVYADLNDGRPRDRILDLSKLSANGRSAVVQACKLISLNREGLLNLFLYRVFTEKKKLVILIGESELPHFFVRRGNSLFEEEPNRFKLDEDMKEIFSEFPIEVIFINISSTQKLRGLLPDGIMGIFPPEPEKVSATTGAREIKPVLLDRLSQLESITRDKILQAYHRAAGEQAPTEHTLEEALNLLQTTSKNALALRPRGSGKFFDWAVLNLGTQDGESQSGEKLETALKEFLRSPNEKFNNFLFVGPPGCGKSSAAYHLGVPREQICVIEGHGGGRDDVFFSGLAKRIKGQILAASNQGQKIILFDDSAALFADRYGGDENLRSHEKAIVDMMLRTLETSTEILTIATVNSLSGIDAAVIDRFGKNIYEFQDPTTDQKIRLVRGLWTNKRVDYIFTTQDEAELANARKRVGLMSPRFFSSCISDFTGDTFAGFLEFLRLSSPIVKKYKNTIGFSA